MKAALIRIPVLTSLMLVLTACPYKSNVPISEPIEKVSKKILGDWISENEMEYSEPTHFEITKFDKKRYEMIEHSYSKNDSTWSKKMYLMHTTQVADDVFLNIQEADQNEYHIHKVEFSENDLTLWEMSDNIDETFNSSTELKSFIEKYKELSFFFNKDEKRYYRNKTKHKK